MEARLIRHLPSGWHDAILVCGKCSKKIGGGFGPKGKTSLAKAQRKALKIGNGRKASLGIVETKCLGVCPKRAVVVARTGGWLVVPAGTAVERLVIETGLDRILTPDP